MKIKTFAILILLSPIIANNQTIRDSLIDKHNIKALDIFRTLSSNSKNNYVYNPVATYLSLYHLYFASKAYTTKNFEIFLKITTPFDTNVNFAVFLNNILKQNNTYSSKFDKSINLFVDTSIKITSKYIKLYRKLDFCDSIVKLALSDSISKLLQQFRNIIFYNSKINVYKHLKLEHIPANSQLILSNFTYNDFVLPNSFEKTYKNIFHNIENKKLYQDVNYYFARNYFKYNKAFNYQTIILPLDNKSLSMMIIIPDSEVYLNDLIEKLTYDELFLLISRATFNELINLSVPSFKTETFDDYTKISQIASPLFGKNANYTNFTKKIIYPSAFWGYCGFSLSSENSNISEINNIQLAPNEKFIELNKPFFFIIFDNKYNVFLLIGKIFDIK